MSRLSPGCPLGVCDTQPPEAARQHVPPYVIFQDKTLLEIALAEPADLERLSHIAGVGQTRLDRYGKGVLEALRQGSV